MRLSIRFVVLLALGLIVAVVVIYFLSKLQPLCEAINPGGNYCFFINKEKLRMVRYMSCSLAKCVNGCDSPHVEKVCLDYGEYGKCAKTCESTCEGTGKECGKESGISFTPKKPFVLNSGEANKLGNWICEPTLWPPKFDWQYLNEGQCNMRKYCQYSGLFSVKACGELKKCLKGIIEFNCPTTSFIGIPKSYADEYCVHSEIFGERVLDYCRFKSLEQEDTQEFIIHTKIIGQFSDCGVVFICPS